VSEKATQPDSRVSGAMWTIVVVALVGAAIGGLMTWHHEVQLYGGEEMQGELVGCKADDEVNCDIVNTSAYSEFLGVPIATWGIPTYLVIALMAGLAARGRRGFLLPLFLAGFGACAYSVFLYFVSKTELGFVCAWCMRLYAINGAILVLAFLAGGHKGPIPEPAEWGKIVGAFAVLALLAVGGQRGFRAHLLAGAPELAAAPAAEGVTRDPEGDAPRRSFEVTTEDGNRATLVVRPEDAWKGNPDAKVVIVEFADFQCGYCKRAAGELDRLHEAYKDRVLFVFKHYPMDPGCNPGVRNRLHRYACKAATAAVCAGEQGLFWEFHDLTFKNQHQLSTAHLRSYARKVGLNMGAFDACLGSSEAAEVVRTNTQDGASLDISGTPRIFVNDRLYRGAASAEQLARAVEQALGATGVEAQQAARALREERKVQASVPDDAPPMRALTFDGLAFKVDTFEAAVRDGKAVSAKREVPATHASWYDAKAACEAAGKRVCSEREWVSACQGAAAKDDDGDGGFADDFVEGRSYPYGDYHDRGRCWDGRNAEKHRPVYTGEMPACVTDAGVYDMTGNVEEWAGDSPGNAVLLGGAYDTGRDHARCYRRNDTFGPGFANRRTGFRCCAD